MAINSSKRDPGYNVPDARGYVCPHHKRYTRKILEKLHTGDRLEPVFDNPSSNGRRLNTERRMAR